VIRPPSDIVADVARAADPARLALAQARLGAAAQTIVSGLADKPSPFDVALRQATSTRAAGAAGARPADAAWRGLVEVLLARMLDSALPADSQALYGGGAAGKIWRGFLAEHLARAAASGQGVGVAAALGRAHADRKGASA
jgi:hypothetical protein